MSRSTGSVEFSFPAPLLGGTGTGDLVDIGWNPVPVDRQPGPVDAGVEEVPAHDREMAFGLEVDVAFHPGPGAGSEQDKVNGDPHRCGTVGRDDGSIRRFGVGRDRRRCGGSTAGSVAPGFGSDVDIHRTGILVLVGIVAEPLSGSGLGRSRLDDGVHLRTRVTSIQQPDVLISQDDAPEGSEVREQEW